MQVDLELILNDALENEISDLEILLPPGYFFEDRSERNWGLAIRSSVESSSDINMAINDFLEPLIELKNIICDRICILRIAVFYHTASCTIRINSYDLLSSYNLPLEVSVYPCSDSDSVTT